MTTTTLRRFHQAEHSMILLMMPTIGLMESTVPDILDSQDAALLTGPLWREAQRLKLEAFGKAGN